MVVSLNLSKPENSTLLRLKKKRQNDNNKQAPEQVPGEPERSEEACRHSINTAVP